MVLDFWYGSPHYVLNPVEQEMDVEGHVVGYARTSTIEQVAGLEAQLRDLEAAGCTKVYKEQVSSIDAQRHQLKAALDYVREGDTFIVTKPDRLARSTRDLLEIVDGLQARGVEVRVLSMNLDTGTPTGKLILTVLGGVATFERELMLERQREGIAKAKAEGKYKGRSPTALAKSGEVIALRKQGIGPSEIARRLCLGRTSVYRLLNAAASPAS
jgi:DNA invertase Pin-like site-specific DNA recombinase